MLDNELSKTIKKLQYDDICNELISDTNMSLLNMFIINQFWRLPSNDNIVNQVIKEAYIGPFSTKINSKIIDDPDEVKILRMEFFEFTMQHTKKIPNKPKDYFIQCFEFEKDIFLIGDYPFVFKNTPNSFADLALEDYLFALTSNRIFIYSLRKLQEFKFSMFYNYNVCIIENSDRYVASSNLKILSECIDIYRHVKEVGLENHMKFEVFQSY